VPFLKHVRRSDLSLPGAGLRPAVTCVASIQSTHPSPCAFVRVRCLQQQYHLTHPAHGTARHNTLASSQKPGTCLIEGHVVPCAEGHVARVTGPDQAGGPSKSRGPPSQPAVFLVRVCDMCDALSPCEWRFGHPHRATAFQRPRPKFRMQTACSAAFMHEGGSPSLLSPTSQFSPVGPPIRHTRFRYLCYPCS
jgi:hypothetical protein